MPFKKETKPQRKNDMKFKHVQLMLGYEFRNMNKDQAIDWLYNNKIHVDKDAKIYPDDENNIMY